MIIVKVQGGNGNQMFQASHVYALLRSKSQCVVMYTGTLSRYREERDLFQPAWEMFDAHRSASLFTRLILKLSRLSEAVDRMLRFVNIHCVDGYFQDQIDLEYASQVKTVIERDAAPIAKFQGVIHCRGGDYLAFPNDTVYWQISLDEYQAILPESLTQVWAVIGNHEYFIKAMSTQGSRVVHGTIQEDLATMAGSERVVCSNSTFCLWGAAFCLLNGGSAAVPARYYIDRDLSNPFDALAHHFTENVEYFGDDHA